MARQASETLKLTDLDTLKIQIVIMDALLGHATRITPAQYHKFNAAAAVREMVDGFTQEKIDAGLA